ncbi:MAG: fimbrillin family protein [Prevotella sp.]|nr:fimbrillin family protein [Prevotella sp.]
MNIDKKVKALSLTAVVLLTLGLTTSCSQEEDGMTVQQPLRFEIFDAGTTMRAATDGTTLTTTFELADQAGLYAVKNGQVVLENITLSYNSNGFWEAPQAIDATALQGAQFYAYYPYREDAQFNASATNPFAQMIADVVPGNKQNTKADYEAVDLMVSTAATIGQYNAVRLPLQHQKALVCVELPNSSYIFDNANMDPYVVAKAENVGFTLNGTAIQPYFDDASQSYRFIVEPGQEGIITVNFTNNGVARTYETPELAAVAAGEYAKFVVDGGASLVNMTLQTGDYYCADGRIVSKDTETLPSNIIGVVFKLGTTEAIRSGNSSWSHGVVISLNEVRGKWGTNASTTSAQNAAGWRYWYRDYNLADQSGVTAAASLNETNMAEEGFEVTKAWRAVPQPLAIGGITLDYTSEMNKNLDTQIADHPTPAGICTGWYYPSLGDWKNIEAQLSMLDTQLTAAKGSNIRWNTGGSDNYWSCNVRGAGSNWCYVGKKTALADRYKGVACNGNAYIRFLLAF